MDHQIGGVVLTIRCETGDGSAMQVKRAVKEGYLWFHCQASTGIVEMSSATVRDLAAELQRWVDAPSMQSNLEGSL